MPVGTVKTRRSAPGSTSLWLVEECQEISLVVQLPPCKAAEDSPKMRHDGSLVRTTASREKVLVDYQPVGDTAAMPGRGAPKMYCAPAVSPSGTGTSFVPHPRDQLVNVAGSKSRSIQLRSLVVVML
ncbi:MAG: hypothetical protein ACO3PN_10595, partial [Chthoniobacterales bacterium]